MTVAISDSIITIDESAARSLPIHELVFEKWGTEVDVEAGSIYPEYTLRGLPAVAGMMIGPKSQVDRVWVTPDLLKKATIAEPFGDAVAYDFTRLCSVGNPIFFPIQGRRDVGAPPQVTSLRLSSIRPRPPFPVPRTVAPPYMDHDAVVTPPTYVKAGASASIDFPYYNGGAGVSGQGPILQLYLFLVPPAVGIPSKRGQLSGDTWSLIGSGTSETYIIALPAFGRNSGYFHFWATGDLVYSARVAAIGNGSVVLSGGTGDAPREETIETIASVTATSRWRGALKIGGWDFIILYYTRTSGTGEVRVTWSLTDDCCASGDVTSPPT